MKTENFAFELPPELIAQQPIEGSRDQSRLMVLNRAQKTIAHRQFFELPDLLQPGDLLVMNDSKVFPARLLGKKSTTGGKLEVLLLWRDDEASTDKKMEVWEALISGKKVKPDLPIDFFEDAETSKPIMQAQVLAQSTNETWTIGFNTNQAVFRKAITKLGHTPIPPYIKNNNLDEPELREKYQTVYAEEEGSAAAPTAGLHFTKELLKTITDLGVEIAPVTLHVGLGTFAPVKVDEIENHKIHTEWVIIPEKTASLVNLAKSEGRRVIAVGTTTVRALEAFMNKGRLESGEKATDIFITPGYEFQCVDAMLTNFHLPRSTLLMMIAAFSELDFMRTAYQEAVDRKYRFYSFGDAMFIE